MLIIFLRTAIILILLMIVMRLMGKRQIGEMQPYEFIITLLIAEAACVPMSDVSIPLLYGIAAILAIFILHQIFSFLEQLGQGWKSAISGKPSLVIDTNGINFKELKKNNLDVEDLIESLRSTGNFSLDEVKFAILEANGKFSVINYPDSESNGELPLLLIDCGKIVNGNIKKIGKTKQDVIALANKKGINDIKNIEVMTIDGSGKIYLQEKNKIFTTFNIDSEDSKW